MRRRAQDEGGLAAQAVEGEAKGNLTLPLHKEGDCSVLIVLDTFQLMTDILKSTELARPLAVWQLPRGMSWFRTDGIYGDLFVRPPQASHPPPGRSRSSQMLARMLPDRTAAARRGPVAYSIWIGPPPSAVITRRVGYAVVPVGSWASNCEAARIELWKDLRKMLDPHLRLRVMPLDPRRGHRAYIATVAEGDWVFPRYPHKSAHEPVRLDTQLVDDERHDEIPHRHDLGQRRVFEKIRR